MQEDHRTQGRDRALAIYVQLALGMAIFGSATPVSKIVTAAMPVFIGSGLRVAIGALTLLPFALPDLGGIVRFRRREWLYVVLIAVFGMFGFSTLMLFGMKMVSGVTGAVVMSSAPAVTAAASMLFMRDEPTWRKFAALALAVAGVLILQFSQASDGDRAQQWLGAGLIFGAVCCEAAYTVLGKAVAERTDPILVAFLASVISLPLFLVFALWQLPEFEPSSIGASAWIALLWYGAGTLALGSWFWYSGVAKTSGSIAAGFMGVMPASALILSYVLLGEEFEWRHLIGFTTVFAGVLLISWEHARTNGSIKGY